MPENLNSSHGMSGEEAQRRIASFDAKVSEMISDRGLKPFAGVNRRLWIDEICFGTIPSRFFLVRGHEVYDEPQLAEYVINLEPKNLEESVQLAEALAVFYLERMRVSEGLAHKTNTVEGFLRFFRKVVALHRYE